MDELRLLLKTIRAVGRENPVTYIQLSEIIRRLWRPRAKVYSVYQAAHGFTVGDVIKPTNPLWVKAQADTEANAKATAVVCEIIDEDNFIYLQEGLVAGDYIIGKKYFLSITTAGAVFVNDIETWAIGNYRQMIGTGTADGLLVEIDEGAVIADKESTIVEVVNIEINNNTSVINQSITQIIKGISGNNHESYLIENTTNLTETVESSWSVIPYAEQVGEFKAVVMVRNKSLDTIITLMNILSFDYSDAVKVIQQNPMLIDANITLTTGVNEANKLFATVSGMTSDTKRIHLCFERCVLSERAFDLEASMELTLEMAATITAYLNLSATSELHLEMQAVVSTYHNAGVFAELELAMIVIPSFYRNLAVSASMVLDMIAEVSLQASETVDYAVFYNLPAVNDARKLAPTDWRVASHADWMDLITFYGGEALAGGDMKILETWTAPNLGATADSKFKALPAGQRNELGEFSGKLTKAIFWIK